MKRLKPNLDLYIHEQILKKFPHISKHIFIGRSYTIFIIRYITYHILAKKFAA